MLNLELMMLFKIYDITNLFLKEYEWIGEIMRKSGIVFFILLFSFCSFAHPIQDTGKDLWLKYQKIDNADYVESLKEISVIVIPGGSTILEKARKELQLGL